MFANVREPGKATSLVLALVVHLAFFVFLYFGISWQRKPQLPLEAQLWSELPPVKQPLPRVLPEPPPPKPQPVVEHKPEPPPEPVKAEPSRADIELKEKQRKRQEERKAAEQARRKVEIERKEEEKRRKEEERKAEEQRKREEAARQEELRKQEEAKREEEERRLEAERREQEARMEREAEARRAAILEEQQKLAAAAQQRAQEEARKRELAEAAAARARELELWRTRIHDRIKSKVVVLPGIPSSARAEYLITVIPGGDVLTIKLRKSSGYPAWDAAVERAIHAAAPLPVPSDPDLFAQMRELTIGFRPD
jgi:colicin import membrane protein